MSNLVERYKDDPDFKYLVNQLLVELQTFGSGYKEKDIKDAFSLAMHFREIAAAGKINISYNYPKTYCYCKQEDIIGIGRRGSVCGKCGKEFQP